MNYKRIMALKKFCYFILTIMLIQLSAFAVGDYGDSSLDEQYNGKLYIRRAFSVLNQAIIVDKAFNNRSITNTSDFMPMFLERLSVFPDKTTRDSFTTKTGDKYTIIPLHKTCDVSTAAQRIDIKSACARVIVEVPGVDRKFELLLYPDGAFLPYNSNLYTLLNGN